MVEVSNAARIVFPEIGRTKGDVVAYYDRVALRALPHLVGRPLSIRRYPKGLAAPGFFQKNVPPHYPESIERFAVPRSRAASKKHGAKGRAENVTVYPIVGQPEHLAYLANQGAIELHVPNARATDSFHPDRLVIDLDPPAGAVAAVRHAAYVIRDALSELGLSSVPIATGSKGYHVVSAIVPSVGVDTLLVAVQKFAALAVAKDPDRLTTVFRIALRGDRVFVDWLRANPLATVVAPYSLRARPRATVAVPLEWNELAETAPDAFTIADVERLLDRPDPLLELDRSPSDAEGFVSAVDRAFDAAGLELEVFDRFRS